jgi:hypothetical protein
MTPRRIVGGLAVAAAVATVLLLAISGMASGDVKTFDSGLVIEGTRFALRCLSHHILYPCGGIRSFANMGVGPYPLLQYLPAAVMVQLGLRDSQILQGFAWLSFASFLSCFGLVALGARRLPRVWWAPVLAVVLLTGPLNFYATSAFGEMLAATLALAAIVAALWQRPVLTFALVLLAGISKETMPPFVVLLAVVAARDSPGLFPPRRMWVAILGGGAAAVILNGAFNLFRFGSVANLWYLRPVYSVPLHVRPSYFAALLAGPGGGLAWFWPSTLVVLGLLAASAVWAWRQHRGTDAIPGLVVLGAFVVLLAGTASWFSPFGWLAIGPRLLVPLMPALMMSAAAAGGETMARLVERAFRRVVVAVAVTAAVIVVAIPQFGLPWTTLNALTALTRSDPVCPVGILGAPIEQGRTLNFICSEDVAWRLNPNPLTALLSPSPWEAIMARSLLAVLCVLLLLLAREYRRTPSARLPAAKVIPPVVSESANDPLRFPHPSRSWARRSLLPGDWSGSQIGNEGLIERGQVVAAMPARDSPSVGLMQRSREGAVDAIVATRAHDLIDRGGVDGQGGVDALAVGSRPRHCGRRRRSVHRGATLGEVVAGDELEQPCGDASRGEEHIEGERLRSAQCGGMQQPRRAGVRGLQACQVEGCCRAGRLTTERRLATESREHLALRLEHRRVA